MSLSRLIKFWKHWIRLHEKKNYRMSAQNFTEEQIAKFQEAFFLFDRREEGYIPNTELGNLVQCLGHDVTELEIQDMINEIDPSGIGIFDLMSFVNLMVRKMNETDNEEEIREAFKIFDEDGNGFICAEELKNVLNQLGTAHTEEEVEEMIRMADSDEDGQVSCEEFVAMMSK